MSAEQTDLEIGRKAFRHSPVQFSLRLEFCATIRQHHSGCSL